MLSKTCVKVTLKVINVFIICESRLKIAFLRDYFIIVVRNIFVFRYVTNGSKFLLYFHFISAKYTRCGEIFNYSRNPTGKNYDTCFAVNRIFISSQDIDNKHIYEDIKST